MNLASIRAIVLDVDGVLTDGTVWWGPNGEEWKRFSFADIMGVSLAVKAGLRVALVSGEDSPLVDRFAEKFALTDVVKGCKDKAAALREFSTRHQIPLPEICFMGDDINDAAAMKLAGAAAAPANAHRSLRSMAGFLAKNPGGQGAVRELIDSILSAQEP